jgi:hypothetical protein
VSSFFGSLLARAAGQERGLAPRPRYRFSPAPSRPQMHMESVLTAVETSTAAEVSGDEVTRTRASRQSEPSKGRGEVVDRRDRPGTSAGQEAGLLQESQDFAQRRVPDFESSWRAHRVDGDRSVADSSIQPRQAASEAGALQRSADPTGRLDSGPPRNDGAALQSSSPGQSQQIWSDPSPFTVTRTAGAREKSRRDRVGSGDPRPAVTIHIGRVEVAAVTLPAAPAKPTQQKSVLRKPSLDQYLQRRERRK